MLLLFIGCGAEKPVQGPQGAQGSQGQPGASFLILTNRSSSIPECEISGVIISSGLDTNFNKVLDATEITGISYVCDGKVAAASSYDIVDLIIPCGKVEGVFNETLLELRNGSIVAYFENGTNRFLNVLVPGPYETSDTKHCKFIIDSKGSYKEVK